jgi:hypothetical protein
METKSTELANVIMETWTESESGWGCRPDGCTLHLNLIDCDAYVKEYWAKMPARPPYEYSRPDESPKLISIPKSSDEFKRLTESRNGIRLWQGEMNKLRYPNGWQQGAKDETNPRKIVDDAHGDVITRSAATQLLRRV